MSFDRALAAADAPRAWREGIGRSIVLASALEGCCESVEALAGEAITICPPPTFGRLIDDIIDHRPPPTPVEPMELPEAPSHRRARAPRPARSGDALSVSPGAGRFLPHDPAVEAAGSAGGPGPRSDPTATISTSTTATSTSTGAPIGSAEAKTALALPPRAGRQLLRRHLAGAESGPDTAPSGESTRPPVGTSRIPTPGGRRDSNSPVRGPASGNRQGLVGPEPRATTPAPPSGGRPVPAGALPGAMARVAERLGARSVEALSSTLRSVPRPGPLAPPGMLERIDAGNRAPAAQAAPQTRPPTGAEPQSSAPTQPTRQTAAERRDTGPPKGRATWTDSAADRTGRAATSEPSGPSERPGTASSESIGSLRPERLDVPEIRQVTSHQEMPPLPIRSHSTGPIQASDAEDQRSTDASYGDDELERRMKRILDEAARRHGIEV